MDTRDAARLIDGAIPGPGGVWADLGAGEGTFTTALAQLLGPRGRIYAVDRDADVLQLGKPRKPADRAAVTPVVADFTGPFALPGLVGELDGILLANALHFATQPGRVLARLVERLRPGGRVVLVEYDRRAASRWVPHPIPSASLPELAAAAGLGEPVFVARRPSAYGGDLYVATADRIT